MARGPKSQTAINSPPGARQRIRRDEITPTSTLSTKAQAIFWAIVEEIDSRGCLDRISLALPTEYSRITALLDEAHAEPGLGKDKLAAISMLSVRQGTLLRMMALSIRPSTTLVRTDAKAPKNATSFIKYPA
jgi:hypothetical protein